MKYVLLPLILISICSFGQELDWGKLINNRGHVINHFSDPIGNQYLLHWYSDSIDVDPNESEFITGVVSGRNTILQKLTPDGDLAWSYNWPYEDLGEYPIYISAIVADEEGHVYVSGSLKYDMDMDPSVSEAVFGPTSEFTEFFLLKIDNEGQYLWCKMFAGSEGDAFLTDMVLDESGELMILGYFSESIDLDPSDDLSALISTGINDIFIAKLDGDGSHVWSKSFGGISYDHSEELEIGNDGDLWLVGSYYGPVDVDPSLTDEVLIFHGGGADTYILHLDENGNYEEHFTYSGEGYETITDIEISESGELIVLGNFDSEEIDLDPTESGVDIHFSDAPELYVVTFCQKISATGEVVWTNDFGWSVTDYSHLLIGNAEEVYIAGTFFDDFDIDPSEEEEIVIPFDPTSGYDVFIGVFNSNGNFIDVLNFSQETKGQLIGLERSEMGSMYASIARGDGAYDCDPSDDSYVLDSETNSKNILIKLLPGYFLVLNEEVENSISIYPNPSVGVVNVNTIEMLNNAEIQIYTLTGELVFSAKYNNFQNQFNLNLALTSGLYTITLRSDEIEYVEQLVIH